MAALIHFPVRRRRLRRGDEGDDVRWLQEKLASFGYEVGQIDGRFGYLTEDALIEFQRDHRLRVDKIAGPQVMSALKEGVPRKRIVHHVKAGERLSDLAQRYGVSVDAIRWMNHLRSRSRLVPGKRLVMRTSYILAGLPSGAGPMVQRTLTAQRKHISGLAVAGLVASRDGSLQGSLDTSARELARKERWPLTAALVHRDGSDLVEALTRRKVRRRFFTELHARVERREFGALLLDFGAVAPGRGRRLEEGLVRLKREFPGLPVIVGLAPLGDGWRSLLADVDYQKVGESADRYLLSLHRWECLLDKAGETPGRDRLEKWVARTARLVPPWKILLGIPMGACRVHGTLEEVGYRAAITAALSQRTRPKADENGFLRFQLDEKDQRSDYVIMAREPFARMIALAHRYRLGGVYLWPAGLEDRRFWEMVARRLWAEPR